MTVSKKLMLFVWLLFMSMLFLLSGNRIFADSRLSSQLVGFSCQEDVNFSRLSKVGKIYTYLASIPCTIPISEIRGVQQIISSYVDHIYHTDTVDVYEHNDSSEFENMDGHYLKILERFDSGHGEMEITGHLYLVSNAEDLFVYNFESEKIDAEGNAKSTKKVKGRVDLKVVGDLVSIEIKKTVAVEKSWMWPEGWFEREVKAGMLDEMKDLVEYHKSLMIRD